jgi:hypothetical protein
MKAYGGVNVQIHVILTSGLAGSGQLHAPAALPPGKQPLPAGYPVDKRLGGPQNRSEQHREENILASNEIRTPTLGHPVRSQSLYWLRYPGSCKPAEGG